MLAGERISVVSQFGTGPEAGHTLDDDEFYFEYLVGRGRDFVFHAPRYALERLAQRFPEHSGRLRELPAMVGGWRSIVAAARSVDGPAADRVIFFGFTERLVLAYLAVRPWRRSPLTLVATNNFSARRARLFGGVLRTFLWLVRPRLRTLVVHTEFEREVVLRLYAPFRPQVMIKKHHLMIGQPGLATGRGSGERLSVSFFGPSKPEKPIEPMLELMRADRLNGLDFRLYGLGPDDRARVQAEFHGRSNVQVSTAMLPREDYVREFASCSLVLLTHTRDFEGKLSGNLCDSIAYGVPYIGDAIEPHLEYQRRYGPIGSLQRLTEPGWAERFLGEMQRAQLQQWRENLANAARDFTRASIWTSLDEVL